MSRRNREKRAAKQKKRHRAGAERERTRFDPEPDRALVLEQLVLALSQAATGEHAACSAAELLDLYGESLHDLDVAADIVVSEAIRAAWEHGWSPSDLHEIARRKLDPSSVRYVEEAIVIESQALFGRDTAPQVARRPGRDLGGGRIRVAGTADVALGSCECARPPRWAHRCHRRVEIPRETAGARTAACVARRLPAYLDRD